jgi:hypothetical protein
MIVAIHWLISGLVTAIALEVILSDLINEPLAPITNIEVWRMSHACEWVLMQRQRRQVLPILADASIDVIVATLHAQTLICKHRSDSLTNYLLASWLASEHVGVCIDWMSEFIILAMLSTYSVYILRRACDGKLRDPETIEQKHICVVVRVK